MPESRRRYPFVQVDVFTERALEGNQLAVFTDARGLTSDEMQALAREMNLSETTFILPRDPEVERDRGVHVRIFTVAEELPFAGHPTLGTAYCVHRASGRDLIELDLKVGKIPVRFTNSGGRTIGEMRQRDPAFGQVHSIDDVAAALEMPREAFDESLPIQTVSTGMAFVITPLRSLAAIRDVKFNWAKAAAYLAKTDGKFFYMVTRETESPESRLHARMIFYNGEDPATGSAAGCCTAWAVKYGVVGSDELAVIEQGIEMKRPSYIRIRATKSSDRVENVRVGGSVVEVMRGELLL